jgi:hypothetical protein
MKLSACLAAAAACLIPAAAFADASTTVSAGPFWDAVAPQITQLIALVGLGVITWVTTTVGAIVKKKFGVDIETSLLQQEDSHRDALQTALTNAAGAVVQKIGTQADMTKIDVRDPMVAAAVRAVQASVPEAIDHFGLTADQLAPKILAKLPQVAPQVAPAPAPTPPTFAPSKK